MIRLEDALLTDILPQPLKGTADIEAYSLAIRDMMCVILQKADGTMLYSNFDKQPDEIVNLMAAELRTPYYDENLPLDKKRQLVKNTLPWYAKAGTAGAVKELVSVIFGKGTIEEWFEYGGKPFHFRVNVYGDPIKDSSAKFAEMLEHVKAAKAVLDVVTYIIEIIVAVMEKMDVPGIKIKTGAYFWGCHTFDGTRLFDGSLLFNSEKRYKLTVHIRYGEISFFTKESMDAEAVFIKMASAVLNSQGQINNTGLDMCCGLDWAGYLYTLENYIMAYRIQTAAFTGACNGICAGCMENRTGVKEPEENINTQVDISIAVCCSPDSQETVNVHIRTAAVVSGSFDRFTITCRRNLRYFDGSTKFDGSGGLWDAFRSEEEI